MIVKSLGIVSKIELAFFIMFIALLVWSFTTYLHVSFAKITPQSAAKKGEKVWESQLDSVALRLGLIGNICLAFLFFPVTRGSSILPLFWSHFRSECQVSHMARAYHDDPLLFSWRLLHHLLDCNQPNIRDVEMGKNRYIKCSGRVVSVIRIDHVGNNFSTD
ncbi:unnamed protein product [Lactuca virosa]|uniref:Uncharacterized protein n=1 Tax=Lactuca virosa TaxID=75947 RepID=A0AAU9PBW1_9ASTR|nr:unnamed protein product [Lactuca virosa]